MESFIWDCIPSPPFSDDFLNLIIYWKCSMQCYKNILFLFHISKIRAQSPNLVLCGNCTFKWHCERIADWGNHVGPILRASHQSHSHAVSFPSLTNLQTTKPPHSNNNPINGNQTNPSLCLFLTRIHLVSSYALQFLFHFSKKFFFPNFLWSFPYRRKVVSRETDRWGESAVSRGPQTTNSHAQEMKSW